MYDEVVELMALDISHLDNRIKRLEQALEDILQVSNEEWIREIAKKALDAE